jgi:hypothetical protein
MLQAGRRATPDVMNARRGITPFDPTRREQRERGLFNFLTWPFLLAQVFLAEEFLGGGARAATADDEQARTARSGQIDGSGMEADLAAAGRRLRGGEEDETSVDPEAQLQPADRTELREGEPLPAGPDEQWAAGKEALVAGASGGGGGGGNESEAQAPANGEEGRVGLSELGAETAALDAVPVGSSSALSLLNPGGALPIETVVSLAPGGVIQSALPLLDSVGPLAAAATDAVSDLVAGTVNGAVSVLAAVPQTLTGLAQSVDDVAGNVIPTVASVVEGVAPTLSAATNAAGDLVVATVNDAVSVLAGVPQTLTGLAGSVDDVAGNVIPTVASVVEDVAPTLSAVTHAAGDLVAGTVNDATSVLAALPQTLTELAGSVGDVAGNVIQTVSPVVDGVAPTVSAVTNAAGDMMANTVNDATSALAAVPQTLTGLGGSVGDVAGNVIQTVSSVADGVAPTLSAVTNGAGDLVTDTVNDATSLAVNDATSLLAEPRDDVEGVIQTAASVVNNLAPTLSVATNAAGNLVTDTIGGAAPVLAAAPDVLTAGTGVPDVLLQGLDPPVLESVSPTLAGATDAVNGLVTGPLGSASPTVQATSSTLSIAGDTIRDGGDDVLHVPLSTLPDAVTALAPATAAGGEVDDDGALGSVASVLESSTSTLTAAVDSNVDVPGEALGTEASRLDGVVDTALRATAGGVGGVAADALGSAEPILTAAHQPLADPISHLAGDAVQAASSTLDTSGSAITAATDALGEVDAEMAGMATDLSEPLLSHEKPADTNPSAVEGEPAIASAEIVIDQLSADLSIRPHGEALASGGSITFSNPSAVDDAPDDLFNNGAHTPYGLALTVNQAENVRPAGGATELDQAGSPNAPSHVHDSGEHDNSPDRNPGMLNSPVGSVADPSSAIDDLASRTGDLLL